ncbi:hypothetical protein C9439_02165 [archaeon SCG-AAA382B04]|nr:hypothetical protein C9439_02165 [archaeon SCG-AAA382B04]
MWDISPLIPQEVKCGTKSIPIKGISGIYKLIEEGFILDVLQNYTTYEDYFNLLKTVDENPEFEETKAKRLLKSFVESHDLVISKKTEFASFPKTSITLTKIFFTPPSSYRCFAVVPSSLSLLVLNDCHIL